MRMKTTESCMKTTLVTSEDDHYTYEVRKEILDADGKTGIVIMLYPSVTVRDMVKCDNTTQALIDHMHEFGWKTARIINIFSKVCKARMSTRGVAIDNENIDYIRSILQEKDSLEFEWVIAWGSSMSNCTVANSTKRMIISVIKEKFPNVVLKQISTDEVNAKNESGLHPLYLKIRNANSKWYLEEYRIPPLFSTGENGQIVDKVSNKNHDKKRKGK